jgi:hypothetical protein
MWWGLRGFQVPGQGITIGMFLPFMIELIMLYLLASAVLPDEVPPEGVNLRNTYFQVSRYFWLLLAALVLTFLLHRIGFIWSVRGADAALKIMPSTFPNLVLLCVMVSLAISKKVWWHSIWLAVLPALYVVNLAERQLA